MEKFVTVVKKAIKNLLISWYSAAIISAIVTLFFCVIQFYLFLMGGITNTLIIIFIVFGLTSFVQTFREIKNERERNRNK